MIECIYCLKSYEDDGASYGTGFCSTYCESSFWMSPTASVDFERIKVQDSQ